MKLFLRILTIWLPLAIVTTAFCGLVYTAVQQNYRQGANDPQIQMAEDTAGILSQGQSVTLPQKIDMAKSLAPFVMLFDENGKLQNSSGVMRDTTPLPPAGVFSFTRQNGEERFTWQPSVDVRNATVLIHYSGKSSGFVLAGRNMREVENREQILMLYVAATWLATIISTLVVVIALVVLKKAVYKK